MNNKTKTIVIPLVCVPLILMNATLSLSNSDDPKYETTDIESSESVFVETETETVIFSETEVETETTEVEMELETETETETETTLIETVADISTEEYIETSEEEAREGSISSEVLEETTAAYTLTEDEIELIALVTMAEAEGECEEGKRLVIDTILNRVDSGYFPNSVYEVVYQPSQFTSMWNGRIDRCYVRDDIYQLVREELVSRTNYDVIFFTANCYSDFGTPLFQVGNHCFSSYQ